MNRPCRVWCGVAVVLGTLAGCADKPTETGSGNKNAERFSKTNEKFNPDWAANGSDAVGKKPEETGTSGSGRVEVAQCQFDTVEKTIAAAKVQHCGR